MIDMNKNNNFKEFYTMLFIYNAINNGWIVQKVKNSEFKFTNKKKSVIKKFNMKNFIENNMKHKFILENNILVNS